VKNISSDIEAFEEKMFLEDLNNGWKYSVSSGYYATSN
jgi:hypothetical protein